nr:helicase-related protein [Vagococcus fluvialis]
MKVPFKETKNDAIDIVLASNIIEVGVDIERLSLMTINGQPKTSAQYIQVSGRVGRKVDKRPGLVVTEYNPTNSNDKSHYEHFVEFHQKLYAQVEESSVTPFSKFAIERGLPAVIIGFLRQAFDEKKIGEAPDVDYIESDEVKDKLNVFFNNIVDRAKKVDQSELSTLAKSIREIIKKLTSNSYDSWEYRSGKKANNGFMVPLTKEKDDVPEEVIRVMFSMRSVDAVAHLSVTSLEKIVEIDSTDNETESISKGDWFN